MSLIWSIENKATAMDIWGNGNLLGNENEAMIFARDSVPNFQYTANNEELQNALAYNLKEIWAKTAIKSTHVRILPS